MLDHHPASGRKQLRPPTVYQARRTPRQSARCVIRIFQQRASEQEFPSQSHNRPNPSLFFCFDVGNNFFEAGADAYQAAREEPESFVVGELILLPKKSYEKLAHPKPPQINNFTFRGLGMS
jgi:hypothetical protein